LHGVAIFFGLLPLLYYQNMQIQNRRLTRQAIIAIGKLSKLVLLDLLAGFICS